MNRGSRSAVSRTFSPTSTEAGSRCSRVPVMIIFLGWGRGRPFVCLLALEMSAGTARRSATVRARSSSSDPAGERLGKKSASPSGPEASAQAVALRAAARRPESEGRKASITHRAAMPSTCVHVDLATSPNSLADQAVFRRVCMTAESLPTDCVGAAMREEHPVASDGSARKFCTGVALGRPRLVMNGYRRGECRR